MPYNSDRVKAFIEETNKLAEEAAQKVFDQRTTEFFTVVEKQLMPGDELYIANGSSFFKGRGNRAGEKPMTDAMERFRGVVSRIQYLNQRASFMAQVFTKGKNK